MRFLGILAFFLLTICSHGQIPGLSLPAAGSAAQAAAETDDPFGRSTPRGTVLGLINAIQREDLPRATKYLDTTLPQAKAETLAEQLKTVLDRRLFLALNDISDQPGGDETDDDDPAVERLGSVEGPAGQVAILLHRVKRDNKQVWLFSPATLHKIPNVYSDIDANWIEQNLPEGLRRTKIAGIPLWRMLTFLHQSGSALLTASFASKLSYVVLDRVAERFAPVVCGGMFSNLAVPFACSLRLPPSWCWRGFPARSLAATSGLRRPVSLEPSVSPGSARALWMGFSRSLSGAGCRAKRRRHGAPPPLETGGQVARHLHWLCGAAPGFRQGSDNADRRPRRRRYRHRLRRAEDPGESLWGRDDHLRPPDSRWRFLPHRHGGWNRGGYRTALHSHPHVTAHGGEHSQRCVGHPKHRELWRAR